MLDIQNFFNQILQMKWSDYLDILVVAFLIYKLLPLVRNPSTMRIVRAILGVVIVAWAAELLQLYTVSFILNQLLAVGLLAFVILFQPELRRMLDHIGSMKLRKIFGLEKQEQEMAPVIRQVVVACEAMSREKVGALIVFARDNRLDEYVKTGTKIDGQVSDQLIRNIFFPKAALHDGAMIVANGRIKAAGCILPVSHDTSIPRSLGLRHRSALGISQATDAIAIVVSEETGKGKIPR